MRSMTWLSCVLLLATSPLAARTNPLPETSPPSSDRAIVTPAELARLDLRAAPPTEVAAKRRVGHLAVVPAPEVSNEPLASRTVFDQAGSAVTGELLAGVFELEYEPDAADRSVVFESLDRSRAFWGSLTGKTRRTDTTIRFRVSEALIVAIGAERPSAPRDGEAFAAAKDVRDLHWDSPLTRVAAAAASGRSGASFVFGRGSGFLVVHVVDPLLGRETLSFYAPASPPPPGLEGWHVEYLLDSRPLVGPRRSEPPEPIGLESVAVALTAEDASRATMITRLELQARSRGERAVVLELPESRIRLRSSGHAEIEPLTVSAVTSGAKELAFRHEGNVLWVDPGTTLPDEGSWPIEIRASVPLYRPRFESYWLFGREAWFPRPRRIEPEAFQFAATIVPPAKENAIATGAIRVDEAKLETRTSRPVRFPAIGAGKLRDVSNATKTLGAWTLAMEKKSEAKKIDAASGDVLALYRRLFDHEPGDRAALLDVTTHPWGSPLAGFIPLPDGAFDGRMKKVLGERDEPRGPADSQQAGASIGGALSEIGLGETDAFFLPRRQFERNEREADPVGFPPYPGGRIHRLAHELAHLWWGQTFRLGSEDDRWLEESIAEYLSAFTIEKMVGKKEHEDVLELWRDRSRAVPDGIPLVAAERIVGRDAGRVRMDLLLGRGPLLLHSLRREIGDDAFFTVLRSFLKSFDGKLARSDDFAGLLGAVTKKDWRPWLDRHVHGSTPPVEK